MYLVKHSRMLHSKNPLKVQTFKVTGFNHIRKWENCKILRDNLKMDKTIFFKANSEIREFLHNSYTSTLITQVWRLLKFISLIVSLNDSLRSQKFNKVQ